MAHDLQRAARGCVQPAEEIQKRGLAGAARSSDPAEFTLTDLEGDPVNGPDRMLAPDEVALQICTADCVYQVTASRLASARWPATALFRKGKSTGFGM